MISNKFNKILEGYTFKEITEGMSPAKVYKYCNNSNNFFLKFIDKKYSNTTYSVKRESEVMKWLNGKLNVPLIIEYDFDNDNEYMLMSEIKGCNLDTYQKNPEEFIFHLANSIKLFQSVDISECPFDSTVDVRLTELDYLLKHDLADTNIDNWKITTKFTSSKELCNWLCDHKPFE